MKQIIPKEMKCTYLMLIVLFETHCVQMAENTIVHRSILVHKKYNSLATPD